MSAALVNDIEKAGLPLSRTLRVLIVEDSAADAALMVAILKRAGYLLTFETVGTPEQFRDQLRAQDYDIILSDHNLLTWTGLDALQMLHASGKQVPFVVATATLGDEAAVEYIKRGAADYILKHRLERLPVVIGQTLREAAHGRQERWLQEKLQCAKREWELTFDTVPDAIFLADGECRLRRINEAARCLLDRPYADIIGQPCYEMLAGICRPVPDCSHARCCDKTGTGEPNCTDAENRVWEASSAPVRDATGNLQGCVHVVRDVTERSRTEKAIVESERKYRELVENTTYGVFRTSAEGRFLDVNPALVKMLGYNSKEEVLRLDLPTHVYRAPAEREAVLRRYHETTPHLGEDLKWIKKDGSTVVVRTAGHAVRDHDGAVLYYEVIAEDITARRTLEAELRQAQKMDAVGRLAGGVAHDFNNLLAVILGTTDLLLETADPEKAKQRIQRIRDATRRAAELTQRLLTFSRKQVLAETVFDLSAVVQETLKLLRPVLGEDVQLSAKLAACPLRIKADQAQVEHTLMNLAVNARDAMPNGGSLIIETSAVHLDATSIRGLDTVTPGEYVALAVSDSGIGMDEQTRSRIFEPFFTTKDPGKGTGLGLAMVYGFVQQSHGFIHVYSEVGQGTTFKIYFPKTMAAREGPAAAAQAGIVGGRETILLAEDESALRELATELLQSLGYGVLAAAGGEEALECARQAAGPIDLLLTDMIMPGISGRELAEQLRALRPQVRVVYMSGYTNEIIKRQDLLAAHEAFVHKPFTRDVLARTIRQVLDRNELISATDQAQLVRETAEVFLRECPKVISSLQRATADHDIAGLGRIARSVQSDVACFGASPALSAAAALGELARGPVCTRASQAVTELQRELAGLREHLQEICAAVNESRRR
ncbi:MAG: response regulator [Terriglobales bacterium]